MRGFLLEGDATALSAGIPEALIAAGLDACASPASVLINAGGADADAIVARSEAFAGAVPEGVEGLIVSLVEDLAGRPDWVAARHRAVLRAFTRHAALAWAPRMLRVNGIEVGGPGGVDATTPASPADVARTVVMMLHSASMTGQVVRLGA